MFWLRITVKKKKTLLKRGRPLKIHSDRIHQKCGTKDGQRTLKETKRCRAPATYFLYWWRGNLNLISKVIQTDSGKAKPNHTKPTNPNTQNKSSEQSPYPSQAPHWVTVSTKAEPFHLAVILLKLETNSQAALSESLKLNRGSRPLPARANNRS